MDAKLIRSHMISSYPRSGTNFAKSLLLQNGYKILSAHEPKTISPNISVITILRDPIETIASHFTMIKFYNPEIDVSTIDLLINNYIKTYSTLAARASLFIDYNSLINDYHATTKLLLSYMHLESSANEYDLTQITDTPEQKHLATSTISAEYDSIVGLVNKSELIPAAYEKYEELLLLTTKP